MKHALFFLSGCLLAVQSLFSQQIPAISAADLEASISFLASDSLKGRKPGTPETAIAARFILGDLLSAGLKPAADNGFQYFEVVTGVSLGEGNLLSFNDTTFEVETGFVPLAYSSSGTMDGGIVFAGFGFDLSDGETQWNDYQNIDPSGNWVLILRGDPEPEDPQSRFIPFSGIRSKVLTAKDKGAAGVLVVTPSSLDKQDALMPLIAEGNDVTAGIPVINITRKLANLLLEPANLTIDSLEQAMIRTRHSINLPLPGKLSATIEVLQQREQAVNVVTLLEGEDPALREEFLVVGAHYDHLGFGGPGSGSRMPDTVAIHNGADDNASGTAMVMALGKWFSENQPKTGRSILFVTFSAEEMGLLGSKYFMQHPPVPASSIQAMFNFDMVGRFDPEKNSISVSGTGTSLEADSILRSIEHRYPFSVVHSPDGYGPSDHAAFYASGIPVFYFNTGVHTDYHTPFDDVERLDIPSSALVGSFAAEVILAVDTMNKPLTWQASGSSANSGRMGRSLKVTFGIMPDFAGTEKKGLRVDGVTKGKPADLGGMLKGDIIVSINGDPVGNIYEYMARLSKLKAGQPCIVEVLRNDQPVVLLIQL